MAGRKRQPKPNSRHQRGYALVAAALALVVFSVFIVMTVRMEQQRNFNERAAGEGAHAAQFAIGLRGIIAAAQADPSLLPSGTQNGVNWLKAPGCGGIATNPDEGYVPCGFRGGVLGSSYETTFSHNITTNLIEARTTFMVPGTGDHPRRRANFADRLVGAALASQGQPNSGVFYTAFANVPRTASAPLAGHVDPGADAGRVVMLATNAPSNDIHLRVDGTNKMLANLDMGNMSIANALDGRFFGDVNIEEQLQVRAGLRVTEGVAELQDGVVAPDMVIDGIGKLASEGIYHAEVIRGSGSVAKPDCTAVSGTPQIYASLQETGAPAGNQGDALYQAKVDVSSSGASWFVQASLQATEFALRQEDMDIVLTKQLRDLPSSGARIVVVTRCA